MCLGFADNVPNPALERVSLFLALSKILKSKGCGLGCARGATADSQTHCCFIPVVEIT